MSNTKKRKTDSLFKLPVTKRYQNTLGNYSVDATIRLLYNTIPANLITIIRSVRIRPMFSRFPHYA